jgi:hypothetical protein
MVMFRDKEINLRRRETDGENYEEIAHKLRFDPEFDVLKHGVNQICNQHISSII